MEVSWNRDTLKRLVFLFEKIHEHPIKMEDDWGYPYDETETSMSRTSWWSSHTKIRGHLIYTIVWLGKQTPHTHTRTHKKESWYNNDDDDDDDDDDDNNNDDDNDNTS